VERGEPEGNNDRACHLITARSARTARWWIAGYTRMYPAIHHLGPALPEPR